MPENQLAGEQERVDVMYARLDVLRARTAAELAAIRRTRATGTHQNRSERDSFAGLHENRLSQLWAVEDRLCFGRLDLTDSSHRYVGRIGLSDDEQRRLLVDWRAPAAMPFYQATAATPGDVVRRRHLVTRGRSVTGVEDDVLDLEALDDDARAALQGEGALLAAVTAQRTGRMVDIVATIQAEQDRIIRSDAAGVLVVQGGPGTGKTAVALHRAAYLLYTHRDRLERSGVLVVGPSPVFLRYIDQVLPSLGETGVVLLTAGQLYPGVDARHSDDEAVAALKGDPRMAAVIARAVEARQRVPDEPVRMDVEGHSVVLRPRAVASARDKARRSGKPHNEARVVFVKDLLVQLAEQMGRSMGTRLDPEDRADVITDLRGSVDVRRALNLAWMPLTPQRLLTGLFADPDRLAEAALELTPSERALLRREPGAPWTTDDVPLLDEAAELIGDDVTGPSAAERVQARQRRDELEYARGVLSMTGAGGVVSAGDLVDRFAESGPYLSVAERAAGDRTWAYGHVVVDEAQELSPMMWRLLGRRCPTRSMTVVGDLAQTRAAAGATSWEQALSPLVGDRWRHEQLTVNYRTPAQIMASATAVLRAAGVDAPAPTSVREGAWPPVATRLTGVTPESVVAVVREEAELLAGGRIAVVTSPARQADTLAALREALPDVGTGATALDSAVAVLTVADAKGLEFDGVVLVEPAEILAGGVRGANDLYVAMTRPTQRLRLLHALDLPAGIAPR
ncbi:MAG TPA: ATP-binding domain-containing protein [Actinomycetales bacterium]|nr:ATP-binding domain-containing protein [Actinomycetales bacterium]